ncbi:MAG: phosphatidate cytidylyltransferase [Xanthomonadales bacterium]
MLRTRILTALVIFPVTLAVVFLATPSVFKGAIAILLLAGCLEFRRICALSVAAGAALLALQIVIFGVLFFGWDRIEPHAIAILAAGCLAWLLLFVRLPLYRRGAQPTAAFRAAGFLSAPVALTTCGFALAWLQEQPRGAWVVFLLLLIIWASDIGAYFSGKQFGRRKLAPVISPNKTWEGVYGGLLLALLVAWLWSGPITGLGIALPALVAMTVATALSSIGGDLFISLHKRTVGVADAGKLFPGHGGVLDRYDSLLAGAPFFALAFGVLAQ